MLNLDYQENGKSTGTLSLKGGMWLRRFDHRPAVVSILPAFSRDRQAVEDFIIGVYAKTYGARIGVHYDTLMSVRDESGTILAALGFRNAGQETLFLEQYLGAPIDHILDVPRHRITEIGNLASAGGGASVFLFAALSAYLHGRGQTHAVVTGTDFIERRLRTLGLNPRRLAKADPELLLRKDEIWGRYYETQPHVLAGDVVHGYKKLQSELGATYTQNRPRLLPRLHYRGEQDAAI
jgi:hypothetical protein